MASSVWRTTGDGWLVLGALVVLSTAAWLRLPSVLYLTAAAVATVGASWVAWRALRARAPRRWWRAAVAALGIVFVASALGPQYTLGQLGTAWPSWEGHALESAAMRLDEALGNAADELTELTASAVELESPGDDDTFAFLQRRLEQFDAAESAVVLMEGSVPRGWAGTLRIPLDGLEDGLGVVHTPFYDVLTMGVSRGPRRAVATLLLQARPPANSLARSLERQVVASSASQAVHFDLAQPGATPIADAALRLQNGDWLVGRVAPLVRDEIVLRTLEDARSWGLLWLSLLVITFLASVWGPSQLLGVRLTGLGVALAAVAIVPLNALSNVSPLFDPTYYFAPLGGALTATVGALMLSSGLVLLALLSLLRSRARLRSRWGAVVVTLVVVGFGPFLLRDLARGIAAPASGVPASLWLAWQTALFLAATAILLAGVAAGRSLLRSGVGLPTLVAPALAAVAALLAQPLWDVNGGWPIWYPALWIAAVGALAITHRTRAVVLAAAAVAGLGATTLVWGSSVGGRMALAERDVAGLTRVDPVVRTLLERFATDLNSAPSPHSRAELLAAYASSDLAAADFAVQLGAWDPAGEPVAQLTDVAGDELPPELRGAVAEALMSGGMVMGPVTTPVGVRLMMAVPHADGWVTTAAVAARTRLFPENLYASLLLGTSPPATEPPYTIALAPTPAGDQSERSRAEQWVRRGNVLHGDWMESLPDQPVHVHVELELRSVPVLAARGALVLLLDLAIVLVLWALTLIVERGLRRWLRARRRRWSRSYRSRLSLALFGFFALPAIVFGIWAARQLQSDARQTRELLVGEALRAAIPEAEDMSARLPSAEEILARQLGPPPLLLYERGILTAASDDLLTSLAPLGRLLSPDVVGVIGEGAHMTVSHERNVGDAHVLVGYRALPSTTPGPGIRPVLAVPAGANQLTLDRRRRDLGVLVLLAIVVGALAALWLSGMAARQLARPIGTLREAALAIAAGEREPPLRGPAPPAEFEPVFSAFRLMAADLSASRSALEEAERRTAAVLRQVASAVVAVDDQGQVTLYNPAAALLFGRVLSAGVPLRALGVPALEERLARLPQAPGEAAEEVVELTLGPRHIHARLTPLMHRGGAVLTLDDVTELARAQRVLAWGEMARQVAHEIKNPLTPIRLGVQHLQRAYGRGREDYERILDQNVERILAEIDRLDQIARAFSRYGTAPEQRSGEPVDVAHVVEDVVELERLGAADASSVAWRVVGPDGPLIGIASADELREVLLNLLENARLAGAREVRVELGANGEVEGEVRVLVVDDGHGIPADVLPRIFEPHFSTRTSGSGLGLAISRRLVESWGGRIVVRSGLDGGTEVELVLAAASA